MSAHLNSSVVRGKAVGRQGRLEGRALSSRDKEPIRLAKAFRSLDGPQRIAERSGDAEAGAVHSLRAFDGRKKRAKGLADATRWIAIRSAK